MLHTILDIYVVSVVFVVDFIVVCIWQFADVMILL